MAEVVGGHNEVLNNEALTAHATAITAIITIKLYTRALVFVYICAAHAEWKEKMGWNVYKYI